MNDQRAPVYSIPKRFYSLDALRGLAALSVVFWHWRHFFMQGAVDYDITTMPLQEVFFAFYTNGYLAVPLFFSLSGFVFFWLYSDRIGHRKIPTRAFVVTRISRLYPLHLATLFIVLAGQWTMRWCTGRYFIYTHNDLYHFILNIFFASHWGFQHGYSFNAPVWSVSIEVLLYAIFFIICLYGAARTWSLCLIAAGSLLITRIYSNPDIWRAVFLFFSGGLVFKLVTVHRDDSSKDGGAEPEKCVVIDFKRKTNGEYL